MPNPTLKQSANIPEIRHALEADAPAISELIYASSCECCFTPEQPCPDWYQASVQPAQIRNLLRAAEMVCLVATFKKSLVCVLAISDHSHVKYFFTHPDYQKLGIGKQLWQFALNGGMLGNTVTVRSSLFAVPVYERLGFKAVEPPKIFNGMHYQKMVASFGKARRDKYAPRRCGTGYHWLPDPRRAKTPIRAIDTPTNYG